MMQHFHRMAFGSDGKDSSARAAFTLIEVLVVVAIIALLISILIPVLAHARDLSRKSVCATQLKEYLNATNSYLAVNNDTLPGPIHAAVELDTFKKVARNDHEDWHLPSFLRRYFTDTSAGGKRTDEVGRCPTALEISRNYLENEFGDTDFRRPFTYAVNNWNQDYSTQIEYGTNPAWYFGYPDEFWQNDRPPFKRQNPAAITNAADRKLVLQAFPKKIGAVKHPSLEWAYGDAFRYPEDARLPTTLEHPPGQWWVGTYQFSFVHRDEIPLIPKKPYHFGGINVAMFDGHAEFQREWRGTVNPQ